MFKCNPEDIMALSAYQFAALLNRLLCIEAAKHAITENALHVPLNITAPDGGEDGRIEIGNVQINSDYLFQGLNLFQLKATDMPPNECSKEISQHNRLKQRIEELFTNGGHYILFHNRQLTQQAIENRIAKFKDTIIKCESIEFWDNQVNEKIHIYDANLIHNWVNKHIAAIIFVQECLNKTNTYGLKTVNEWKRYIDFPDDGLYLNNKLENKRSELLRFLLNHEIKNVIRISGEEGCGKSSFAAQIFYPYKNEEPSIISTINSLRESAVFIDAQEHNDLIHRLEYIVRLDYSAIIIIDSCTPKLHEKLVSINKQSHNKLKFISIGLESIENIEDRYTHCLMTLEGQPNLVNPIKGFYLYRQNNEVHVLVVHGSGKKENINLTKLDKVGILKSIKWPERNAPETSFVSTYLNKAILEIITPNCKYFEMDSNISLANAIEIDSLLRKRFPSFSDDDLDKIEELSFDNVKQAVALAKIQERKGGMLDLASEAYEQYSSLIQKSFWLKHGFPDDARDVFMACCIFNSVGYTSDAKNHYKFIAKNILKMDAEKFYAICQRWFLKNKHFVLNQEHLYVALYPLQVLCAADWWYECSYDKAERVIFNVMSSDNDHVDLFFKGIANLNFLPSIAAKINSIFSTLDEKKLFNPNPKNTATALAHLTLILPKYCADYIKEYQTILIPKSLNRDHDDFAVALSNLCKKNDYFNFAIDILLSYANFWIDEDSIECSNDALYMSLEIFSIGGPTFMSFDYRLAALKRFIYAQPKNIDVGFYILQKLCDPAEAGSKYNGSKVEYGGYKPKYSPGNIKHYVIEGNTIVDDNGANSYQQSMLNFLIELYKDPSYSNIAYQNLIELFASCLIDSPHVSLDIMKIVNDDNYDEFYFRFLKETQEDQSYSDEKDEGGDDKYAEYYNKKIEEINKIFSEKEPKNYNPGNQIETKPTNTNSSQTKNSSALFHSKASVADETSSNHYEENDNLSNYS